MRKRVSLTPYLFLAPALIVTLLFNLIPVASVIGLSFTEYDILRPPEFVGLGNFADILTDQQFWLALRNSFTYLIVTPILIVLSIGLAIVVNRALVGIGFFRALYYLPVISGSVAIGIAWQWLFARQGGLINGALMALGLLDAPVAWLTEPQYTIAIAMLVTIWSGVGFYMVVFLAGLQSIPQELYDAAAIDGCNAFQSHLHVTVPGLRPSILFVAVISGLAALKVFDEIYVLTNGTGGVLNSGVTLVFYLWKQAFRLQNAGYASAVAVILLLITMTFSILNVRYLERRWEEGG
jgi:putative chitobiose transport system permease protein